MSVDRYGNHIGGSNTSRHQELRPDPRLFQVATRLDNPSATNITLPPESQHISTPSLPLVWKCLLTAYPNQELVSFFLQGLTEGFRIGYDYTLNTLKPARTNMESALPTQQ